jgi:hypothetical protein
MSPAEKAELYQKRLEREESECSNNNVAAIIREDMRNFTDCITSELRNLSQVLRAPVNNNSYNDDGPSPAYQSLSGRRYASEVANERRSKST